MSKVKLNKVAALSFRLAYEHRFKVHPLVIFTNSEMAASLSLRQRVLLNVEYTLQSNMLHVPVVYWSLVNEHCSDSSTATYQQNSVHF